MQWHGLDFVQGLRTPCSERKWPGAFIDRASPGLSFTALCQKQSNTFQASSCAVTPSKPCPAKPSKPCPAALAQHGVGVGAQLHEHRFLPLGDLPLQILIQLTLLSLWDLRRWKYFSSCLQAMTNDCNVNQNLHPPARYRVWDSFPSPAHAVFSPKTATSAGKHAAGGTGLCVSISNTSSFSVHYILVIRHWEECQCLEIFWLQLCHCLFSAVSWFTGLHSSRWIRG